MTRPEPVLTRLDPSSAPDSPATYLERRAALTWPLLALGLIGPVLVCAACVVLAVVVDPAWLAGMLFAPLAPPFLMYIPLLFRNWPSGILIDGDGVRIGAVASKGAAERVPSCAWQAWGVFHVPWSEIESIDVLDAPRIRQLRRAPDLYTLCNRWSAPSAMRRCQIGVLLPCFARSVLVITVWTGHAKTPQVRPVISVRSGPLGSWLALASAGSRRRVAGEVSAVWIAPTRHPEALRAAVRAWARQAPPADPARYL